MRNGQTVHARQLVCEFERSDISLASCLVRVTTTNERERIRTTIHTLHVRVLGVSRVTSSEDDITLYLINEARITNFFGRT